LLLVTCYLLLVTCYLALVACCLLLVAWLPVNITFTTPKGCQICRGLGDGNHGHGKTSTFALTMAKG
jgi:hypothetical protein